jgi:uncharacterized delta-60 repeat protein
MYAMSGIGLKLRFSRLTAGVLCLLYLGSASALIAQAPAWLNTIVDGPVTTILVQPDGRILLGGRFASVNNRTVTNLARLMPNGSLDTSFQPGSTNVDVRTLAFQDDGRILVQGFYGIERLNTDGTPDTSFRPFRGAVKSMLLQQDHKILLRLWGQSLPMRLNTNGALDNGFKPVLSAYQQISALGLQRDGKILVSITSTKNNYCELNRSTKDGAFELQLQVSSNRWEGNIYQQGDKPLLVRSDQSGYIIPPSFLERLNPNGTLDTFFRPITLEVPQFAAQSDGKILVMGALTPASGEFTYPNLWRLNGDGSLDSSLSSNGQASIASSIALEADGSILYLGYTNPWEGETNQHPFPPCYLYRHANPTAATESLLISGSTITWLRGGSAPLAWRTIFERSANGTEWVLLGEGEPVAGGWQLDGASLQPGDIIRARGYVAADNGYGPTSSYAESRATVDGLAFLRSPGNHTNNVGARVQFAASVAGKGPVGYQWQKDGADLPGATQSVVEISRVEATDAGVYSVIVTNVSGSITSTPSRLEVVNRPIILTQPLNQRRSPGASANLTVQTGGAEPLHYQWNKDDAPILDATNSVLALENLSQTDVGSYRVTVTNQHGAITSVTARVELIGPVTMSIRQSFAQLALRMTHNGFLKMILESSSDLVHWEEIRTFTEADILGPGTKGYIQISVDPPKGPKHQFYRVRLE